MSDSKYPSDTADRFLVRFPPGMRDKIAEHAKANGRSMNAEIVSRIATSFGPATEAEKQEAFAELLADRVGAQVRRYLERTKPTKAK